MSKRSKTPLWDKLDSVVIKCATPFHKYHLHSANINTYIKIIKEYWTHYVWQVPDPRIGRGALFSGLLKK
jgi:hypothetical protein